jgi:hypothetical protein
MVRCCASIIALLAVLVGVGYAHAAPNHRLAVETGLSRSRLEPKRGWVNALGYGARLDGELWFVARFEMVLNIESSDLMKGSAYGVDGGLEWQSADVDRARLFAGAALGGRFYNEPGLGGVLRFDAGAIVPLGDALAVYVAGGPEFGVARVGDDMPQTEFQLRGDALLGLHVVF